MSIGKRLRHYRTMKGMTQENVADALGIKVANYSKYELGERNPRKERLIQLAKILGVGYSTLIKGDESIVVDLLNVHLRGAVTGSLDGFYAFISDVHHYYDSILKPILDCFDVWDEALKGRYGEFHSVFLEEPNLSTLTELDNRYKKADEMFNSHHSEIYGIEREALDSQQKFNDNELDDRTIYKMAFCIAAERYMDLRIDGDFNSDFILAEIREYSEKHNMSDMEALQTFSVLVFVPFLSHILDTLEFIADNDSNIDDFAIAFLFYSLTADDEDESVSEDDWTDLD